MDLIRIILDDIRRVTHSARTQERQFAQYINQKNSVELRREMNSLQKELDARIDSGTAAAVHSADRGW